MSGCFKFCLPTDGVDFDAYLRRVVASVKRNWFAIMPESANMGDKGIVSLTFRITKDGIVPVTDPNLERTSGKEPLDNAAMSAIRTSSPFEPLPPEFKGDSIRVAVYFLLQHQSNFDLNELLMRMKLNRTQVIGTLILAALALLVLLLRYWKFSG